MKRFSVSLAAGKGGKGAKGAGGSSTQGNSAGAVALLTRAASLASALSYRASDIQRALQKGDPSRLNRDALDKVVSGIGAAQDALRDAWMLSVGSDLFPRDDQPASPSRGAGKGGGKGGKGGKGAR